ncbi:putative hydrolase [Planctopirus ephydatiae]|uniref:Putative hydrolase n=2 Tax=Planctopirus ephydatiae TaxID=2528019 RepID=A0A518GPW7_9PLAN|nr:putative hydrolase [Planctopirus ephydatiae]
MDSLEKVTAVVTNQPSVICDMAGLGSGTNVYRQPMSPRWWLRSGHLQTIACGLWPVSEEPGDSLREVVELEDGDRLTVYANFPAENSPVNPSEIPLTVLLMPGLCGDHRSGLIRRLTSQLLRAGVSVVRMNHRGCGEQEILAQRPYHAGRTSDLLAAIDWWKQSPWAIDVSGRRRKIALCGISLSGNILLKTLGVAARELPAEVVAALAINPPIDLMQCVKQLSVGLNWIYDQFFVRRLYGELARRKDATRWPKELRRPQTLLEFDEFYTAPRSGFASAEEYYRLSSARSTLDQIELATTVLTARDDPLIPVSIFTDGQVRWSPSTRVVVARSGGHVGYFETRQGGKSGFWLDEFVAHWALRVAGGPVNRL